MEASAAAGAGGSGARAAAPPLLLLLLLLVLTSLSSSADDPAAAAAGPTLAATRARRAARDASASASASACGAFRGVRDFDALVSTPRPSVDCAALGLRRRPSGRALLVDAFMVAYEPPLLLLLRILETVDSVDAILILESDYTFTGLPRNLSYPALEPCLARWSDKIFFRVLRRSDVPPDFFLSYLPKDQPMLVERFQRDAIAPEAQSVTHALRSAGANGSGAFLGVSDVDEFPRPDMLEAVASCEGYLEPVSLRPDSFMYSFRWLFDTGPERSHWGPVYVRFDEAAGKVVPWAGGEIMAPGEGRWAGSTPAVARGLPQEDRFLHGAWHLSYFLDAEAIRLKLASFSHTEYAKDPRFSNLTMIRSSIDAGQSFFDGSYLDAHNCLAEDADVPQAVKQNPVFRDFACPG